MTIRDEFLEILRVLVETPEPTGKKPPSAEKDTTTEPVPDKVTSDKQGAEGNCKGAAS
jgi:hypothetical protein